MSIYVLKLETNNVYQNMNKMLALIFKIIYGAEPVFSRV